MVELYNAQITPLDRIEGNIWYGKGFQTETQKNAKMLGGYFKLGCRPATTHVLGKGVHTICKLQQSTPCKRKTFAHCQRILNALAPAAGMRVVAEERLSEHRAKSSGSNGDNDVSHLQSIQGVFRSCCWEWIFTKWVILDLPRLRALATKHGEDWKEEMWGLIGQGLASYNSNDLFGSSRGKRKGAWC